MGNSNFKTDFDGETITGKHHFEILTYLFLLAITKNHFTYQYCIGKGGFGKVWKVEKKKSKQLYAMKEMSKARILTKRSVKSVMNERQILT